MGPPGVLSAPGWPHLGPMGVTIRGVIYIIFETISLFKTWWSIVTTSSFPHHVTPGGRLLWRQHFMDTCSWDAVLILITATWDVRQTLQIFWTVDTQDSRLVRSESRMRNWRELINVGLICCNTWRLVIRVRNRHSTDGKVITLHGKVIT